MQLSPQQQQQIRQQLIQRRKQLRLREMYKQWKLQQLQQLKEKVGLAEPISATQSSRSQLTRLFSFPFQTLQAQQFQQHHQQMQMQMQMQRQHQQAQQHQHQQYGAPGNQAIEHHHQHHQPTQQATSCVPAIEEMQRLAADGSSTSSPKLRRLSSFRRGRITPIKKKSFKAGGGLSSSASACTTVSPSPAALGGRRTSFSAPSHSFTAPSAAEACAVGNAGGSADDGASMIRRARSFSDPSSTWPAQQHQLQQLQQMRHQQQQHQHQMQQNHHQHQQQIMQQQMQQLQLQHQHHQQQQMMFQQHQQHQHRPTLPVQPSQQQHHQLSPRPIPQHQQIAAAPLAQQQQQPRMSAQIPLQPRQPHQHQPIHSLPSPSMSYSEPVIPSFGQRQESMDLESVAPSLSFSTLSTPPAASSPFIPAADVGSPPHSFQSLSALLGGQQDQDQSPAPPIDALHQLNLGEIDPSDALALEMADDQQFLRELMEMQQQHHNDHPQSLTNTDADDLASGHTAFDGSNGGGDIFEELGEIISLPDDLFDVAAQAVSADHHQHQQPPQHPGTSSPDVSSFGSPSLLPASPSMSSGLFFHIQA
jgi:hypothetical protein